MRVEEMGLSTATAEHAIADAKRKTVANTLASSCCCRGAAHSVRDEV